MPSYLLNRQMPEKMYIIHMYGSVCLIKYNILNNKFIFSAYYIHSCDNLTQPMHGYLYGDLLIREKWSYVYGTSLLVCESSENPGETV